MAQHRTHTTFLVLLIITIDLVWFLTATASDGLPRSLKIPLVSRERIPISKVFSHPAQYQMREIRLTGIVTVLQTEVILDWRTCGSAHERTTFTVEDDSGTIELIDMGACGRNMSAMKAPMLQVGQQVNLLVHILLTGSGTPAPPFQATIRYIEPVRE